MWEDIEKLIEKGKRSLKAAKALYERNDYDFAVSRAYYSMYYATEAVLLTKGLVFSKHSGIISAFGQYFVKPGLFSKNSFYWLRTAFDKRSVGDYSYNILMPSHEAEEVLEHAEEFIVMVEDYLKEERSKQK